MDDLEGEQEAQLEKALVNITPSFARASAAGVLIPGVPMQARWALRSSARMRTTPFLDSASSRSVACPGKLVKIRNAAEIRKIVLFIIHVSGFGLSMGASRFPAESTSFKMFCPES
jgi:hypothetical protein